MNSSNPVLVEVWRGDMVESRHHGAAAIVDAGGRVVESWGSIDQPVFARSAIKPLQALPLLETGAAERYGLGDPEIALACASHRGEPQHTERVARWLQRVGLGPTDLECGSHLPYHEATARALIRAGAAPSTLHSNCSGKHSGFLTTARHRGEETRGYIAPDHPVQRRVTRILEEMSGLDLARAPRGTDGCGIPVIGLSLHGMARAMARLGDTKGLNPDRAHAARRILDAMRNAPLMVSGTGTFASEVMSAAGAQVRVKPGAEGVYCAVLPEQGVGVALKIDDGAARASEVAMGALLLRLKALDATAQERLAPKLAPISKNIAGRDVGQIRAAALLAA
jgi:L-asparaginase II